MLEEEGGLHVQERRGGGGGDQVSLASSSRKAGTDSGSSRNAYSKLLSMSARLAALEAALGERIRQQALTVSKDQARESTIVTIRDAQEDAWLDAPLDPGEGYWSRPEVLASRDSVVAALGHIHVPAPTSYTSSSSHSTTHSDDERSRATVSTAATSPRWSECSTLPPSPSESPRVNPRSSFDHDLLASFDHPCLPLSPPRKSLVFPPSPLLIPIPLPLRLPVPESSPLLDLCDISTNLDNSRIGARVSFERAACGA